MARFTSCALAVPYTAVVAPETSGRARNGASYASGRAAPAARCRSFNAGLVGSRFDDGAACATAAAAPAARFSTCGPSCSTAGSAELRSATVALSSCPLRSQRVVLFATSPFPATVALGSDSAHCTRSDAGGLRLNVPEGAA